MRSITESSAFRAIAEVVVPQARHLDEAGWRDFAAIIDHALADRPASLRRQLALLVRALNALALATHARSLSQLGEARRVRLLERIERAPLPLLRRGFWGLRTLIFMGYYARPGAKAEIGYRAHAAGWQARQ